AISGLYDLEPIRRTEFLQGDLRLTTTQVNRLSPAFFPRPKSGKLYAVVGADESDEFIRHNQLIRDQWGPTAVPVCETVPGKTTSRCWRALPTRRAACTSWRCAC
ncbi:MAG: hypothetical protein HC937_02615, partial [Aquincola sp.]|nr:hypothetical protein [Aquincola sp.]